ncbi:MAG: PilN domain-containing protein [Methylococcaceae bacterium]|jgi:type IV pilus assembly protein PilN|nr:PilN domain-containing protein [Methylococcaceae bacterium]
MANINLLPWRQARRKRQQRDFAVLTSGALVITALLMVMVHANIAHRIEYQQQRNQFLTSEIAVLDQKIKEIQELEKQKKSLIARMGVIQKLQTSRPEAVHLFDELARTIPEGVQLMDLTQTDRTLTLNGIAQSNARVSVYMRNLELSPWLQEPSLLVIESRPDGKEKKDRQMSRFSLKVTQSDDSPKDAAKSRP